MKQFKNNINNKNEKIKARIYHRTKGQKEKTTKARLGHCGVATPKKGLTGWRSRTIDRVSGSISGQGNCTLRLYFITLFLVRKKKQKEKKKKPKTKRSRDVTILIGCSAMALKVWSSVLSVLSVLSSIIDFQLILKQNSILLYRIMLLTLVNPLVLILTMKMLWNRHNRLFKLHLKITISFGCVN